MASNSVHVGAVPPRARPNLHFESSQRLEDWTPSNQEPSAWLGSCQGLYFCAGETVSIATVFLGKQESDEWLPRAIVGMPLGTARWCR